MKVYEDFGFNDIAMKIALRPDKRIGSDEVWDKAEHALRAALSAAGVEWEELPGEGAFYGPEDRVPHEGFDRPGLAGRAPCRSIS